MSSSARITREFLQRLSAQRLKSHSDFSPLCIVASISNLRHIDSAYGASLAANVLQAVLRRARVHCREESGFAAASGSHILCVFECGPGSESTGHHATDREAFLVDKIIDVLGCGVEDEDGGIVYPAIVAAVVARTDVPLNIDEVFSRLDCEGSPAWCSRYVADMKTAEELLAALNRNELCFGFEKVCKALDTASVLYYEMLLCRRGDGVPVSASEQIASLERVGLIGRLDKWVVASAIDMLRARSDLCVGCNISAQSATLEGWWRLAMEVLRKEPEIASRLVIEITESSIVTDVPRLSDFIKALQRLGCRVALDDIGVSHLGVRRLFELGVDIVKLHQSFVRRAIDSALASVFVSSLVTLANACAKHVVMEGVENEDDLRFCRATGVHCVQGYLFEPIRPDKFGSAN